MSKKAIKYDAQGREIVDDDETIRDGQRVRVPMQFSDGKTKPTDEQQSYYHADNRPKSAIITDQERSRRQKLYSDADAKLENAWREGAGFAEGGAE